MANPDILQRNVGELVAEDYRRATAFKKHGIDFCCGGNVSVQTACVENGVAEDVILQSLNDAEATGSSQTIQPADWPLGFLVDYIVNKHHWYIRESVPLLHEFTKKVARVHGPDAPELIEIAAIFDEVAEEMDVHMAKEERMLFPYIKHLADPGSEQSPSPFGSVSNPIRVMEDDHDKVANLVKEIRRLSNDYTPPAHACATYRVSFAKLQEFEEDLHQHVHLENNVLFPKALKLGDGMAVN